MPISYGNYEKQLKLLPISINADGTATVGLKSGFVENGIFTTYTDKSVNLSKEAVDSILNVPGVSGLTRKQDLSIAVYNYLMSSGLIEPGQIV